MSWLFPTKKQRKAWTITNKILWGTMWAIIAGALIAAIGLFVNKPGTSTQLAVGTNSGPINQVGDITENKGQVTVGTSNNSILVQTQVNTIEVKEDFIEGTTVTRAELKRTFPYGYIVFFLRYGERLRYEVDPDEGQISWNVDTKQISIKPDFAARLVVWNIAGVSATIRTNGVDRPFLTGEEDVFKTPMEVGNATLLNGIVQVDYTTPQKYIVTLSDNPRLPVFALGFAPLPKAYVDQEMRRQDIKKRMFQK